MAAEILTDDKPEVRLSRFLFIGKEYLNYQPGYWFNHHYFMIKNVPSIEELADIEGKDLLPIQIIIRAFESNLVPHKETLMFALAVCCRQDKSKDLRHAAYETIQQICKTTQDFILFIRFVSKLSREKELNYVTQGWGHGLRKAINNWYLSKEPMDLAKCVTRYRSRYGWKHKDIIKMSHPSADNPEKGAILKYVILGMEKTKEYLRNQTENSNVDEIMEYIQNVENFKHCEDAGDAAAMLEAYGLTLDHVPGHLLKSKEVWNSLISSMDIITLLNNLHRIQNLTLLKDDLAAAKVIDKLTDADYIACSKVHPALIFITIKDYQHRGRPLSYEKRKVREIKMQRQPPPLDPNFKVTKALHKAFYLSFSHIQPTKMRYLVTISMNKSMVNGRTWRNDNLTGAETGCLIAMMLLRVEENVTVTTFKNVGIHKVHVDKTHSFNDMLNKLKDVPVGSTNLSKPIIWATKQSEKFDVFINIVDQVYEKFDNSQETLISYRKEVPDAKLINCAVCSSSTYRKKQCDPNVLTINGFDPTVPNVIQAFALGLF